MRRIPATVAFLLIARTAFAAVSPDTVATTTLQNGLKILVQEDHTVPSVAMYLFFKVGSRNEGAGTTGISHFFEHMMFNGAKKYGPKQFDTEMEKNGGHNNAYTTRDVTVYTDWFPRDALALMMDMESDRMGSLSFDPKMIESERGVVYSERLTSVDNSTFGILIESLNAAAYEAHPYHWPVVGWASDIKSWTIDDLKHHFAMGYAPNNCVMVVVGDVSSSEVFSLARKNFESIPRHDPPPPVRTVEPPQHGERRTTIMKEAQLPVQAYSYHIPATKDADNWPLQVLANALSTGQSSRLYESLLDKHQLAIQQSYYIEPSLDPGQLVFVIQPKSGVDPAESEKVFLDTIDQVRKAPFGEEELRKAKNQTLTSFYRDMKTISGRANLIGTYEVFEGDYRKLFTADQEIEAVTAADVARVAQKYLSRENLTVGTLIPQTGAATSNTDSQAKAPAAQKTDASSTGGTLIQ